MLIKRFKIHTFEMGLLFRDQEFQGLLNPGTHWFFDPLNRVRVNIVNQRDPWLNHDKLDVIVKTGVLAGKALVLDLKDHERALIWIDERFNQVIGPGLYALWTEQRRVRAEVVDARQPRFEHEQRKTIVRGLQAARWLDNLTVARDQVGVLFIEGRYVETLPPGEYVFWKAPADVRIVPVDTREAVLDVIGQDIITADKVTLRVNAVATYQVADARQALLQTEDVRQALYRDVQLALRAVVGTRELDAFLAQKDALAAELMEAVRQRAAALGLTLMTVGIRDVILPGDMKELMNKVTEARKAAEANLIARREETAAMRSQANTAKLLAENPVLMRLRELEVLERIAANGKLNIVLGEKGLADTVIQML